MGENTKPKAPAIVPPAAGDGIEEGNVVPAPWPTDIGIELVALLRGISSTLASIDARMSNLERLAPQALRNPLAGLLRRP